MKLLTKAIEAKLLKASERDITGQRKSNGNRLPIVVKFFNPTGAGTWYIAEGTKLEGGDWELFGLCDIFESELGYVLLSDLKNHHGRFGLGIERDLHFSGKFLDTSKFPVEVV